MADTKRKPVRIKLKLAAERRVYAVGVPGWRLVYEPLTRTSTYPPWRIEKYSITSGWTCVAEAKTEWHATDILKSEIKFSDAYTQESR